MPVLARGSLPLLLIFASCFFLPACTRAVPGEEIPAVPEQEQLAAEIASFGDLLYTFDQLRAVVVATDDEIVFEEYYETDQSAYWGMQSVTKSVVSTLVGIALEEGLIGSLDGTLAELLPDYADVMSPQTAGITLRQLLTMTAGLPSGESAAGPEFLQSKDWVRHILTHPELPPGERFVYSNGSSHLLSAILQEAAGTSALSYARSRLFGPLGIDTRPALVRMGSSRTPDEALAAYDRAGFAWPVDPQGVNTGWWGIRLRPRDMVKIGQLFLADGRWEGQQLVPAEWVDQATAEQATADGLAEGYGYQWWTDSVDGDQAFLAMGWGGQLIVVMPDRGLVVVVATEVRQADASSRGIDLQILIAMVEDTVAPHFPAA